MRQFIARLSLAFLCALPAMGSAQDQSLKFTTEQQRAAVGEFIRLYRGLNAEQRSFVLPLIANAVSRNLPVRDDARGLEVRQFRARPNETVAMRVRWLNPMDGPDDPTRDDLQGMLPMVVRGMGCSDVTIAQIVDAGIRIQVEIENDKGESIATTLLDSAACKSRVDDIEAHVRELESQAGS